MVDHLSNEQKQEFIEAFDLYDRDYSGEISKKELIAVLRTLGQHPTEEGDLFLSRIQFFSGTHPLPGILLVQNLNFSAALTREFPPQEPIVSQPT